MKRFYIGNAYVVLILLALVLVSVSASSVSAQVRPKVATSSAGGAYMDAKLDGYRSKILAEIDRRIGRLNELLSKISSSNRLSSTVKNAVVTNITNAIAQLTNTRSVVLAAADMATLRAQAKVATDEYKTFTLVVPQAELLRVAERQLLLSSQLASLSANLANKPGASSSALPAALAAVSDMLSQINTRANAVISNISALQVGGAAANRSVLLSARSSLSKNFVDFKQIMTDVRKMFNGLGLGGNGATGSAKSF